MTHDWTVPSFIGQPVLFWKRRTDKSTSSKFQGIETPSQVSVLSLKGVTLGN